jgi:hypothetical protein
VRHKKYALVSDLLFLRHICSTLTQLICGTDGMTDLLLNMPFIRKITDLATVLRPNYQLENF